MKLRRCGPALARPEREIEGPEVARAGLHVVGRHTEVLRVALIGAGHELPQHLRPPGGETATPVAASTQVHDARLPARHRHRWPGFFGYLGDMVHHERPPERARQEVGDGVDEARGPVESGAAATRIQLKPEVSVQDVRVVLDSRVRHLRAVEHQPHVQLGRARV